MVVLPNYDRFQRGEIAKNVMEEKELDVVVSARLQYSLSHVLSFSLSTVPFQGCHAGGKDTLNPRDDSVYHWSPSQIVDDLANVISHGWMHREI